MKEQRFELPDLSYFLGPPHKRSVTRQEAVIRVSGKIQELRARLREVEPVRQELRANETALSNLLNERDTGSFTAPMDLDVDISSGIGRDDKINTLPDRLGVMLPRMHKPMRVPRHQAGKPLTQVTWRFLGLKSGECLVWRVWQALVARHPAEGSATQIAGALFDLDDMERRVAKLEIDKVRARLNGLVLFGWVLSNNSKTRQTYTINMPRILEALAERSARDALK